MVEREPIVEIETIRFDLTTENFYLLLATGVRDVSPNSVSFHEETKLASPKSIFFRENEYEILNEDSGIFSDQFYEDCGVRKTCVGVPQKCVAFKNCDYLVSFRLEAGKYNFELKSIGE